MSSARSLPSEDSLDRDADGARRRAAPTMEAPYTLDVLVRYGETDQMGVVHHANFLLYLEDARSAMLRECGLPYSEVERAGVALPVREARLQYRRPAHYEDVLVVSLWVERTRAASVTFGYEIHRRENGAAGPLLVTAEIELACMDLATRRPRVFPDSLREIFGPSARRSGRPADDERERGS